MEKKNEYQMKMNKIKIIAYILVGILTGLLGGYLLFNNHSEPSGMEDSPNSNIQASINTQIYTCSMHPQIRQNEPGICPICEMDLIPLDNSMGNDDPTVLKMSKEAAKLAQIETFVVGGTSDNSTNNETPLSSIKVDGTVELDERTIMSQTAHLDGRIDNMIVTFEGQYVNKGQKIATIYSTGLMSASQELLTASQFNDRVEGLKDAAIQKLKNWKISDSQIEKIISSGKPMETIDIFADYSGFVLSKKIAQGDYVKQGQTLYTVGSTSNLWLIFNVFESELSNVKSGSKLTFTTPSVPNEEFNAKVSYIDPLLNGQTRTAVVRAEISNSGNKLKPGMLLNGLINVSPASKNSSKSASITVPNSAILWTGERSVVYVQLPEMEIPSYQFREVKVSNRSNEYSVVEEGLENGDEVVTHGAFAIDAAAQLNNNMSMMNRKVMIKNQEHPSAIPSYTEDTPDQFKNQLDQAVSQYITLKNALVATDSKKASLEASILISTFENVDMKLIKDKAHMYWMEQLTALNGHATKIKNTTDIEEQRAQFDFLSIAMINALKAFGTDGKTYYVQYCPMAKDNQGADWIAVEKQIMNPYFGDKMLKCGSVKLELN